MVKGVTRKGVVLEHIRTTRCTKTSDRNAVAHAPSPLLLPRVDCNSCNLHRETGKCSCFQPSPRWLCAWRVAQGAFWQMCEFNMSEKAPQRECTPRLCVKVAQSSCLWPVEEASKDTRVGNRFTAHGMTNANQNNEPKIARANCVCVCMWRAQGGQHTWQYPQSMTSTLTSLVASAGPSCSGLQCRWEGNSWLQRIAARTRPSDFSWCFFFLHDLDSVPTLTHSPTHTPSDTPRPGQANPFVVSRLTGCSLGLEIGGETTLQLGQAKA